MEVLHESPLSIIGPEESSFPRKRAATEADIENKYTIKTLQHLSQGINRVISGRCSLDPLLQVHDALLGGLITQAPSVREKICESYFCISTLSIIFFLGFICCAKFFGNFASWES